MKTTTSSLLPLKVTKIHRLALRTVSIGALGEMANICEDMAK